MDANSTRKYIPPHARWRKKNAIRGGDDTYNRGYYKCSNAQTYTADVPSATVAVGQGQDNDADGIFLHEHHIEILLPSKDTRRLSGLQFGRGCGQVTRAPTSNITDVPLDGRTCTLQATESPFLREKCLTGRHLHNVPLTILSKNVQNC